MDCGERVERLYDSLYPAKMFSTFGATQSLQVNLRDQAPRLRTPPPNRDLQIPSKFIPDPSATAEQTRTAAFGDTTRSFGPSIAPLTCSQHHFVVPKPMTGDVLPGTTHYVPRRGTSEAPHLPTSPGTRRNLTPAKSDAEERANQHMRQREYKAAVRCYSEALRNDSRNANLYRNRAAANAQLAKFDQVLEDTQKVCQLMPNNRKAIIRHKAVVDYLNNYHECKPGSDRANLTVAQLLMPEEFSSHNFTTRLTTQLDTRPRSIPTAVDPVHPSFYEKGAPTSEPLIVAQRRGARYFWETQSTSPENRTKHIQQKRQLQQLGQWS